MIQAADELIGRARISEATWGGLEPRLGVKALIELIHVIGNYDLIAMFMNSTGLDLEEDVADIGFGDFAGT